VTNPVAGLFDSRRALRAEIDRACSRQNDALRAQLSSAQI
jgi:hypothetical protein